MSCGLACVATGVGGTTEVLGEGKYGILVSPKSTEELTEALVRLGRFENERDLFGSAARQHILDRYDFPVVGRRYHDLYNRLVEVK